MSNCLRLVDSLENAIAEVICELEVFCARRKMEIRQFTTRNISYKKERTVGLDLKPRVSLDIILHLIKRITLERSETYRSMEQEKQYSLADVKLRMIVMRKMGTAPLELLTPSGATELSYITRTRNLRPEHNLLTIISQRSTSS